MANVTVKIPHELGRAEVKRRLQERLRGIKEQPSALLANLQETWVEDRLDFSLWAMGQFISGHLLVEDRAVDLQVELPWLLSMLAKPIKQRIEQNLHPLLAAPQGKQATCQTT
jgi:hypothetical protein